MKKLVYIVVSILFFASCEKDISVDLPQPSSKVVVDGYVETGFPPYILLSRNSGYFQPLDAATINNNAETDAEIIISDGFTTDTMLEVDTVINGYQVKGIYIAINMIGTEGRTYSINIRTKSGEELSSAAKLVPAIPLDSLWFKVQENKDSLGFVWAKLKDPDTLNNCYRWFAKRITKDPYFIAPFGSVFEDRFINGQRFDFCI